MKDEAQSFSIFILLVTFPMKWKINISFIHLLIQINKQEIFLNLSLYFLTNFFSIQFPSRSHSLNRNFWLVHNFVQSKFNTISCVKYFSQISQHERGIQLSRLFLTPLLQVSRQASNDKRKESSIGLEVSQSGYRSDILKISDS